MIKKLKELRARAGIGEVVATAYMEGVEPPILWEKEWTLTVFSVDGVRGDVCYVNSTLRSKELGEARQAYIIEALNFVNALIEGECHEAERKDQ